MVRGRGTDRRSGHPEGRRGEGGVGGAGPESGLHLAKARLLEVVEDLESEMAAIAESTADSPDDEHDAEGSTVGYERARVTGLLQRARRELAGLEAALLRLAAGTYGRCEQCGLEIGTGRLEAVPSTRLCVTCATPSAPGLPQRGVVTPLRG